MNHYFTMQMNRRQSLQTFSSFALLSTLTPVALAAPKNSADRKFVALYEEAWEFGMKTSPESATWSGDHRFDHLLSINTPEQREKIKAFDRDVLKRAKALSGLSETQRTNHLVFVHQLQASVDGQAFDGLSYLSLNAQGGIHTSFGQLVRAMPFERELHYRNYLARLAEYPRTIDEEIAHLRRGMAAGWVTFAASMARVPSQIEEQIPKAGTALEKQSLFEPFTKMPASMAPALQAEFKKTGEERLKGVYAAWAKLLDFLKREYMPKSPESGALSSYPNGAAAYNYRVREQTTTTLAAKEIHAIGEREVARLRARMEAVITQTGFKGNFAQFIEFINTDPRFYFTSGEELLAAYRDIGKRVDPQLPKLFAELPRLPYGIRAIPAHEGIDTPEYYTQGTPDGSRAGYFNANILALKRRPKWEMESLFCHEAVPGHHLQTARALEMKNLPMFRRTAWYVAYGEGWALYAEGLGEALGLYTDPYSLFGALRGEIWRACRLVVDTGIHALGWSRQRAIDYMAERSGIPLEDVTSEIDRYFVWPGQALGYMIGKLRIEALRDEAKAELGERFSIRDFHMTLLDSGPVPLEVMQSEVRAWVARAKVAKLAKPAKA
jgi:uncharacterized protein (DUF885 family)